MKRLALLLVIGMVVCSNSFAQKKDSNAWKEEGNLELQFDAFKKNVNFWNGSYFMKPEQINEFHGAIMDSVSLLETNVSGLQNQIRDLKQDLSASSVQSDELKAKLDESIRLQNSITVFGLPVEKTTYAVILYSIIIGLLVVTGIVFMLFKRSNSITVRTQKEYNDLKEEYETHKKSALDRYTKMNMELHKTRLELNKR